MQVRQQQQPLQPLFVAFAFRADDPDTPAPVEEDPRVRATSTVHATLRAAR